MKKFLNFCLYGTLVASLTLTVSGCYNPLTRNKKSDCEDWKPSEVTKDIKYYQNLIKKTNQNVANCHELIKEIEEKWKNDPNYQMIIEQVFAGLYTYQSEINEYQYQILLLEKGDKKFTYQQILQGLKIMDKKLLNLELTLKIETKYPNDYPKSELIKIQKNIKITIKIKNMFLKLREENEKNGTISYNTNDLIYRNSRYD